MISIGQEHGDLWRLNLCISYCSCYYAAGRFRFFHSQFLAAGNGLRNSFVPTEASEFLVRSGLFSFVLHLEPLKDLNRLHDESSAVPVWLSPQRPSFRVANEGQIVKKVMLTWHDTHYLVLTMDCTGISRGYDGS